MKNQSGFAPLLLIGLSVLVSIGGAGAYVYNQNQNSKKADSLTSKSNTNTKKTDTSSATAHNKRAYQLPDNWRKFTSTEGFTSFAYPTEYGQFVSPAKGEAGKYANGGFESETPTTPSVAGLSGRFTYNRYTDASPVISSGKYGPDIQLTGSTWKVVGNLNSADPDAYKVGDTYKRVSSLNSAAGIKVYMFSFSDEDVRTDKLAFVDNGVMFTITFPSMTIDTYGSNSTAADVKARTVSYENLVSRVLESVGN